jgi:hypothetical protein
MKQSSTREAISTYLSLFASLATLFCCALPALLVLVGLSLTSVLTFFTAIPGWQNFGAYDIWLFPLCGARTGDELLGNWLDESPWVFQPLGKHKPG